jgi:hypothetical protein
MLDSFGCKRIRSAKGKGVGNEYESEQQTKHSYEDLHGLHEMNLTRTNSLAQLGRKRSLLNESTYLTPKS